MIGKVLVAGIGNIFLGDDGWGVEVANRLALQPMPDGVRVADFGIRGVHLAYELLDGYETLVLIDAMPMGEAPGTVAVIDADVPVAAVGNGDEGEGTFVDAHSMNPGVVIALLAGLGASVERILVVGCEPDDLDEGIGLSPAVAAAVDDAVDTVRELVAEITGSVAKETTP